MKHAPLAAIAALALMSTAALAGEGNGDIFALRTPGITRTTMAAVFKGFGQDPYQFRAPGVVVNRLNSASLVGSESKEAVVQTLNSLPVGAASSDGMATAAERADIAARRAAAMRLVDERSGAVPRG